MTPGVPSNTSIGRTTIFISTKSPQMKCLGKPDHAPLQEIWLFSMVETIEKNTKNR